MFRFTLEDNYLEHLLIQYGMKYKNIYQVQIQFFKRTLYFFNHINIKNIIKKLETEKYYYREILIFKINIIAQFINDLLDCKLDQMIDITDVLNISSKNTYDDFIHYIENRRKIYTKTYRHILKSCLNRLKSLKNII